MAARVAQLWRHPIKGLGSEAMSEAQLSAGQTMPWDRVWAVAHEASRLNGDADGWVPCSNFCRGAKAPSLMAVRARIDETGGRILLSHPERPDIEVNPDDPADAERLIDWVAPLVPENRAQPSRIVRAKRGMTDSDFPSIAVLNLSSLLALSQRLGCDLQMERFRGNIWLEGLPVWGEFDLVGHDIEIGTVVLRIRERITRCRATSVDTTTGKIDVDTLAALEAGWGHQDFGIYAEVVRGGRIATGDEVRVQ